MNGMGEGNATVLLVEDEESLARGLKYNLEEEGYSVACAEDGRTAIELFDKARPDLVILDIMLPYVGGFEVAAYIRERDPRIPILVLTARAGLQDRITGLQIGADDYLTKPFHLKELLLRVGRMIERSRWYGKRTEGLREFRWDDICVSFERLSLEKGASVRSLTSLEASLLEYFAANRGRIVTREELLERVWNVDAETKTRTIDNFVLRLRKLLESDPENPLYLQSVRGSGYIFLPEGREHE